MPNESAINRAVRNLLQNGAGLHPATRVLIVHEPDDAGYYGAGLAKSVERAAKTLGYDIEMLECPFVPDLVEPPGRVARAMVRSDLTLFLARMGDQIRFRPHGQDTAVAICYALDLELLASDFGELDHRAMRTLRDLIDRTLRGAKTIRVTCPAGTELEGSVEPQDATGDTHALRFPLSVYTPVSAVGFSGTIAQRGFLVGTGSRFYEPYAVPVEETLFIRVDKGRIAGFDGPSAETARAHYLRIAERFGVDPWAIHSWHGGIHPACAFPDRASASFERWSGGAFGNTRLLHFHTCGAYAPGEICLNLLDPTVVVNGTTIQAAGRISADALSGGPETLAAFGRLRRMLANPVMHCGEAPGGGLSFR